MPVPFENITAHRRLEISGFEPPPLGGLRVAPATSRLWGRRTHDCSYASSLKTLTTRRQCGSFRP